ncbi:MAG: conjugal transfer protein TraC [Leptolyngbya sp.]|nr:MAG: conjugal transfer protein TraC [Leptolyngbya sp.]
MTQIDMFNTESADTVQDVLEQRRDRIEEKQDARAGRYKTRATKNSQAADSRHRQAEQIGERFAGGQPILVGHHSEKGARRDQARMWNATDKAMEHQKKAAYWAERLAAMEANTAISSDDPDALEKLQTKLENLIEAQELMKRLNKLVKKIVKLDKSMEEKAEQLAAEGEISAKSAYILLTPDSCRRIGFPSYKLTNNNANIRRVKERIKTIEAQHAAIATEGEEKSERHEDLGLTVVHNHVLNRIQLRFDTKPSKEIREHLGRDLAFNWAASENAWQRQLNGNGIWAAERAVSYLRQL